MARGLADGQLIGAGHLDGGLVRLGASRDQVEPGPVHGHVGGEAARVGLEHLARELRAVDVRRGLGLPGHGGGDLAAAVAHVHDHGAARAVDVAPSLGVPEQGALAASDRGQGATQGSMEDGRLGIAVGQGQLTPGGTSPTDVQPPSTSSDWPVMWEAAGERRKRAAEAMSSTLAARPRGTLRPQVLS